jgi:hypothetical protein
MFSSLAADTAERADFGRGTPPLVQANRLRTRGVGGGVAALSREQLRAPLMSKRRMVHELLAQRALCRTPVQL